MVNRKTIESTYIIHYNQEVTIMLQNSHRRSSIGKSESIAARKEKEAMLRAERPQAPMTGAEWLRLNDTLAKRR